MTLGWRVTSDLKPVYWLNPKSQPGQQAASDLVEILPSALACHTLLIANSGAGKSFFLGRVLEEVVLKSPRTQILVLDPNSDFRRFFKVRSALAWKQLPMTEGRQRDFKRVWPSNQIAIKVGDSDLANPNTSRLTLPWLQVSPELIGDELEPSFRHDVFHCHLLFHEIVQLSEMCGVSPTRVPRTLLKVFEAYHRKGRDEARELLLKEFDKPADSGLQPYFLDLVERAADRPRSIDDRVEHYYVSRLLRYGETNLIVYTSSWEPAVERVRIIDLPSFEDPSLALMVINSELRRIWALARESTKGVRRTIDRHAFLIVVDEAHHLAPATTNDRSVDTIRQEIRRIVAEGRKFGLYLILASQRPEKLDEFVTSECENLALMRMSSPDAASRARQRLQFDDYDLRFERAADFSRGLVALYGQWAGGAPKVLASGGRRTEEGGLSLPENAW